MKQALLTDIELDIEQLKCLINSVHNEYNPILCEAAKRNVLQIKSRLDSLYQQLIELSEDHNQSKDTSSNDEIYEFEVVFTERKNSEKKEDIAQIVPLKNDDQEETTQSFVSESLQSVNSNNDLSETSETPVIEESKEDVEDTSFVDTEIPPAVNEEQSVEETSPSSLSTIDIRQFISLNDSFRFSREIFGGDAGLMKNIIDELNNKTSFEEALDYLNIVVMPDEENEATLDFIELLRKSFNR